MYSLETEELSSPKSSVTFQVNERINRVSVSSQITALILQTQDRFSLSPVSFWQAGFSVQVVMWMNQNFLLQEDIVVEGNSLHLQFMSLRGCGPLIIKMEQAGQVRGVFLRMVCELVFFMVIFAGVCVESPLQWHLFSF